MNETTAVIGPTTVHYTHHHDPRRVTTRCSACGWKREYKSEGRAMRWAVEHLQTHTAA